MTEETNIVSVTERDTIATPQTDTSVVSVPSDAVALVIEQDVGLVAVPEDEIVAVESKDIVVVAACSVGPTGATGETGDQGPQGDQGPIGPTGPAGAGAALPTRKYIPVATTDVIDALPLSVYRSAKWMLTVTDRFNAKYRVGEVLAFHDGAEAKFVHYAIFGDAVQYAVDVVVIGSDMAIRVTNADAVEIVVDAVRVGHLSVIS